MLMVQRVAVEIAEQQIDVAQNGHLPTVSLSGEYSTNDTESTTRGITVNLPRMDTNSIGLNVRVPIFLGSVLAHKQSKHAKTT